LEATDGDICRLRCGYHLAIGIHELLDNAFEFAMADVATNTIDSELDENNRADFFFSSATSPSGFRVRSRKRKVDVISFDQKPLSDCTPWTPWTKTEKAACRSKPNNADLERVVRAFTVLAKACGA